MALAYANAALGVTITTLTDVLAIGVGAFTQFETVHIFCAFAGAGIAFDFFYQVVWRSEKCVFFYLVAVGFGEEYGRMPL